jgi:hypothetical protein
MKAILRGDNGDIWVDTAPDVEQRITLTIFREYEATPEVVNDGKWGPTRVFKQVDRRELLQGK